MSNGFAITPNPASSVGRSTGAAGEPNITRMKNLPVSISLYCCASRMFCPLANRKVETADTMPGRSGQDRVRTNCCEDMRTFSDFGRQVAGGTLL